MKNIAVAILLSGIIVSSSLSAQTNSDEVKRLTQRVAELEKQVQEIARLLEPLKAQQSVENRRKALREKFEKQMSRDQAKYSPEQLREAENLYQVANQKWGSAEATESLQAMIKKYPDINRTGCAVLYVGQRSEGEQRVKYLRDCIEKYNDCFYGDGVQVGVYARFLLAEYYKSKGQTNDAEQLFNEIRTKYPEAVDHSGRLLVESIKTQGR
jgi:DNA repair exonuclease SbcCD ATPase subunit